MSRLCIPQNKGLAESSHGCRSNGETTFEQDIVKKSRCAVHVFDPTLDEATAAQVMAIKGVTFHPYGLGALDGVVSIRSSGIHLMCHGQKELPDIMLLHVRGGCLHDRPEHKR